MERRRWFQALLLICASGLVGCGKKEHDVPTRPPPPERFPPRPPKDRKVPEKKS
jgi:hypothetical protein